MIALFVEEKGSWRAWNATVAVVSDGSKGIGVMGKRLSPDHREYLQFHRDVWQELDQVSLEARALYCTLLTFENYTTNTCRPCQKRLCRHLGISLDYLRQKLVPELIRNDLIRTEKQMTGKVRYQYIYTLYAPRVQRKSKRSSDKRQEGRKIVDSLIQNNTNSTYGTIQESGSLG